MNKNAFTPNEHFSNDPNNDTDVYNENSILNKYFDMIKSHDYSYMMSDDHRYYERGVNSEKKIEELLYVLCGIMRIDAERLLEDSLSEVNEQYRDGLTHKTIRGWFSNYIQDEDPGPEYDSAGFTEADRII